MLCPQVDEFLELADERLLYDIRTHPLFTNRSKFVSLGDEEREQLTEAKRLIDLVTRNRRASEIFRFTGEVPLQVLPCNASVSVLSLLQCSAFSPLLLSLR